MEDSPRSRNGRKRNGSQRYSSSPSGYLREREGRRDGVDETRDLLEDSTSREVGMVGNEMVLRDIVVQVDIHVREKSRRIV